jgi:alkanesulfonate monooxygenase SsuD/methylene tetrahydromethanopterin reductase-like flavin-dependent oxidoreductase (luciferase family)
VLSQGRTIATLGVGGEYAKQFELLGIPVSERGRRTGEAIEVIRELWTKPVANCHGRFFDFDGVSIMEPPCNHPTRHCGLAEGLGASKLRRIGQTRFKSKLGAIRRAGTYGDGWCPYYVTPEAYKDSVAAVTDVANRLDRDVTTMPWALTTFWLIRDSYDDALEVAKAQNYVLNIKIVLDK